MFSMRKIIIEACKSILVDPKNKIMTIENELKIIFKNYHCECMGKVKKLKLSYFWLPSVHFT